MQGFPTSEEIAAYAQQHGISLERAHEELTPGYWEILVPTQRNDGRPIHTRFHRVWDAKVREITGGLSIMPPIKGQWVSPNGELFAERMIPVRIVCRRDQIDRIIVMTADYYDQEAVLSVKVSDEVAFYLRSDDKVYHGK